MSQQFEVEARLKDFLTVKFKEMASVIGTSSRKIETDTKQAGTGFNDLSKAVKSAIGIFAGFMAVRKSIDFLKDSATEAIKNQEANINLSESIRSMGKEREFNIDLLKRQASEMQKLTNIEDEEILTAQSLMITYDNISSDSMPRVTKAVANLSVKMKTDMTSAAMAMGKALKDPGEGILSLNRSLRLFTKAEIDGLQAMVDLGRGAEAQEIILTRVERKVGDVAEATRNLAGGELKSWAVAWGEFKEQAGAGVIEGLKSVSIAITETGASAQTAGEFISNYFKDWGTGVAYMITGTNELIEATKRLNPAYLKKALAREKDKSEEDAFKAGIASANKRREEELAAILKKSEAKRAVITKAGLEEAKVEADNRKKSLENAIKYKEESKKLEEKLKEEISTTGGTGREEELSKLMVSYNTNLSIVKKGEGDISVVESYYASKHKEILDKYDAEDIKEAETKKKNNEKKIAEMKDLQKQILFDSMDANSQELTEIQNLYDDRKKIIEESLLSEAKKKKELGNLVISTDKQRNKVLLEQEARTTKERSKLMTEYTEDTLGNLSAAVSGYKSFFNLYKLFAISETLVGTFQSAQKIFNSIASQVWLGPLAFPLAVAGAGAATLSGMSRVNKIKEQKFSTGGYVSSPTHALIGESGPEAVLNPRATASIGIAGVNALNSGQPTRVGVSNQISYAPVYNISSGDSQGLVNVLKKDKIEFAKFFNDLSKRGYLE